MNFLTLTWFEEADNHHEKANVLDMKKWKDNAGKDKEKTRLDGKCWVRDESLTTIAEDD